MSDLDIGDEFMMNDNPDDLQDPADASLAFLHDPDPPVNEKVNEEAKDNGVGIVDPPHSFARSTQDQQHSSSRSTHDRRPEVTNERPSQILRKLFILQLIETY